MQAKQLGEQGRSPLRQTQGRQWFRARACNAPGAHALRIKAFERALDSCIKIMEQQDRRLCHALAAAGTGWGLFFMLLML